ncbi:MAG: T9SS type A sorting domain-containing protein, partial [Bacteroidales bacterium]|nr:T9SS type A sorting domain-containing protein [Bacteroidales bacterium]
SEVYNIKPWQQGGQPELAYDMNKNWMNFMSNIYTNTGQRLVASFDNLLGKKWLQLFDPFNAGGNFPVLAMDSMNNNTRALCVAGDTVYYGKKIGNDYYLTAQKVQNDSFVFLDTIKLTMTWGVLSSSEIMGISVENGIIAVGYGPQFALFNWNGNSLNEMFVDFKFSQRIMDIEIRNNLVYVADRFFGFKVYDVSSHTNAILVAEGKGTGGWTNVFGSTAITVGDDGTIFLCDFHGGVFVYEAFDTTLVSTPENQILINNSFLVYPNPVTDYLTLEVLQKTVPLNIKIEIFNMQGSIMKTQILKNNKEILNVSYFPAGVYVLKISTDDGITVKKFIVE